MKSGFVMLAGRSNVGKSTLLNALVGSKISIVTPKPQTTRFPIRGILHDKRGQLVFIDTPGVFLGKKDRVSRRLNEMVRETLQGIDAIVYVVDPTRAFGAEETFIQHMLRATTIPIVLVINKTDLAGARASTLVHMDAARLIDVGQRASIELSAHTKKNLNLLVDALFKLVPEGEVHYPDLQLTDIGHAQWLEELIREKVFLHLDEELPYTITVSLEETHERPDGSRYLCATIWSTHERYKKMILGTRGAMLKRIGTAARKELELITGAKIFLELRVKIDPKWQERFSR